MRKLLVLAVILFTVSAQAQEVERKVDEFTNKVSYSVNAACSFEKQGKGQMVLLPTFTPKGELEWLGAMAVGIGCLDDAKIYILFEDGEVINKTMFNDFNCDGLGAFKLSKSEWDMLATKKIAKVKLQNKARSIIGVPDNPNYFIRVSEIVAEKDYL